MMTGRAFARVTDRRIATGQANNLLVTQASLGDG